MKTKYIFIGLFIAVIAIGCESNEVTPDKMYLKGIIDPNAYKDQFEYQNGQLTTMKRLFGERVETLTTFTYQNGQLKTIETTRDNGLSHSIELEYNDNNLRVRQVTTTRLDNQIDNVMTVEFFYDNKQNLKSKKYSYTNTFLPSEIEFEWSNGNIVKRSYSYFDSNGKHFISSENLLFDNKRNYTNQDIAFSYTGRQDEAILSKNNLISALNTFVYNKIGYPIGFKYTIDNTDYPVQMNYE
jgi:hypothetical protein